MRKDAKTKTLIAALEIVCDTLARVRDDEPLPQGWSERLKYEVVDRALECALPGFDGGTTSSAEAARSFARYRGDVRRKAQLASPARPEAR